MLLVIKMVIKSIDAKTVVIQREKTSKRHLTLLVLQRQLTQLVQKKDTKNILAAIVVKQREKPLQNWITLISLQKL